jgi:chromosome segregation protein
MRLKSLSLKGFKSFANDTTLHFNEDVIGIVGPNGSGKSNIVDAIRWVLGEQKGKELRLESMGDVIFNGTKKRKEAPSAIVTLTFDNEKKIIASEYQEVAISRVLYRSGESEYRINDVPCRLKDIRSLFIDTGIGSDSYAIIALGMVDDILADKENARRKMFEQAAGISRFKTRKKETLGKLNLTNQDLDRVEDLVFEIEGNMKTLERQAKRTKRYFEIKEEYKELSMVLAAAAVATIKDKQIQHDKAIKDKQAEYHELAAGLAKKEAEVQQEKAKYMEQEQALSDQQKKIGTIVHDIRNMESEKQLTEQRIAFSEESINNTNQSINKSTELESTTVKEKEALSARISTEKDKEFQLSTELKLNKTVFEQIKQQYDSSKALQDALSKKLEEIQKKRFEAEKQLALYNNKIENASLETKRLKEEQTGFSEEVDKIKLEKDRTVKLLSAKKEEHEVIQKSIRERDELLRELSEKKEKIKEELNQTNRSLDARKNEYDLLKSMMDNMEGFPESIKFLHKEWNKSVPVLSDVLDVEEAYKPAIEQYLENYLNHFVVSTIEEASQAIKLLTSAQRGKAHFFILNQVKEDTVGLPDIPNAFPVVQVVHSDGPYMRLIHSLLNNVYIYEGGIDDFTYNKALQAYTFLAKSGNFVKSGNVLSGGSLGLFEGKKIGRKKNLEKLHKQIEKIQEKKIEYSHLLSKNEESIQTLKNTQSNSSEKTLLEEINSLQQDLVRWQTREDSVKRNFENSQKQYEAMNTAIQSTEKECVIVAKLVADLKEEQSQLIINHQSPDEEINQLAQKLNSQREIYNDLNIQVIRQQNLVAGLQKELDFKQSRLEELNVSIRVENQKLHDEQKKLVEYRDRLKELSDTLIRQYEHRNALKSQLSEVERTYFEIRNQISKKEDDIRTGNRSLNQTQVELNQLKDLATNLRFEINAFLDRVRIEFEVSAEELIKLEVPQDFNIQEAEEKIQDFRKRLQNFGEINPMALQAYEEIKERYDNIVKQRADIVAAKETLLNTMREIEATATEKFMAAFSDIRENFIMVFRSLFTEDDSCDLILLEEENPLESPIEIIAKPKGKKPKSLSQLSGGEKTLTATALLFALYLLKPAPFCIFDEVDAPLDDANIAKFNKIIKKFSEQSQFIIVTHNKATMSAVDVLYGVYMQEAGVSGVVEVDFREIENTELTEIGGVK